MLLVQSTTPGPPPKGGLLRLSPLQEQARMGPGERRWLSQVQNDAALTVARDPHLLSQLAARGGGTAPMRSPTPATRSPDAEPTRAAWALGAAQMDGGATGMDEDTYQHLPILVAGGNTLLSIPMEQQVVHGEASHLLSPHMTKKGIERHMISALQNAALKEVRQEGTHSSTRMYGMCYTRGWVTTEQCQQCGLAQENCPRRACFMRRVGMGAHGTWKRGLAHSPPVQVVLCAWCTGGAEIDWEAERDAPFLVWDAERAKYRACTLAEMQTKWQRVDRDLRQQWEGEATSWGEIPQYYYFGNKPTAAFYNKATPPKSTPTSPRVESTPPSAEGQAEATDSEATQGEAPKSTERSKKKGDSSKRTKQSGKRSKRSKRSKRKGKPTPPSSDGSEDSSSTDSSGDGRGGHPHRQGSETESGEESDEPSGGGSSDGDFPQEECWEEEQRQYVATKRLKAIAEETKYFDYIEKPMHNTKDSIPKLGPEVNPVLAAQQQGTEVMEQVDPNKKAMGLHAARVGLAAWESLCAGRHRQVP